MMCGLCNKHYGARTLVKHADLCEDDIKAPSVPTCSMCWGKGVIEYTDGDDYVIEGCECVK